MLLCIRKSALSWSLAVALPAVAFGQTSYSTNGGEYLIAGSLPGDQVHPQLSLCASGGYLVWEDNAVDGNGSAVQAAALDSSFSRVLAPFRVSQKALGAQERPQVTLLNNGGAAFFWQGGRPGFQHVYARFVSATNTWLGGDVRVSTPANNFQINPAIATLTNGNVVAVWGSYNQYSSSSMQDVYGRILTPAGAASGSEFLVNQFTAYNQRTPAVAALAGGGFVVVWVSEQQRTQIGEATNQFMLASQIPKPSVDVYGRLFNADGTAASDEFLVNADSEICANPRVAAGTDGGFVVVWGQKNAAVPLNSWDVLARPFATSSASPGGAVSTVNTHLYGDQYIPQITSLGTNYLVVWTSLGQDGDREGVYGQFLGGDGSSQGGEFRVNTTTVNRQMHPAVAADSLGRFVAVWTSYVGGANGFDLEAQIYAAPGFVPPQAVAVAAYQPPPALPGDDAGDHSGDAGSGLAASGPVLQYPGTNWFATTNGGGTVLPQGVYSGLFYETGGVAVRSAGYFTAKVGAKGAYSAKVVLGGRTTSVSGRFDTNGWAKSLPRKSSGLAFQLQLDLSTGSQLGGQVQSGTNWTSDIYANRQVLTKSARPQTQAGKYTFVIPPDDGAASPAGYGYGTITLDSAGNLRLATALADGTKISQSSSVSKDGVWPVFSSLYGGGGLVMGWMQFTTNSSDSDFNGQVIWLKPGSLAARYHPAGGFTNAVAVTGSLYNATNVMASLLWGSIDTLVFSDGGLSEPFTAGVSFDAHNKLISDMGKKLSLGVTLSSGLLKGAVTMPETGKVSFQGVLFEKGSVGLGYFLGPNQQSGAVDLSPAP